MFCCTILVYIEGIYYNAQLLEILVKTTQELLLIQTGQKANSARTFFEQ